MSQGLGHFEGSMGGVLLPRCAGCGAPHPGEGVPACPDCGARPGKPRHFRSPAAVIGGPDLNWLERALLRVGAWLQSLAAKL